MSTAATRSSVDRQRSVDSTGSASGQRRRGRAKGDSQPRSLPQTPGARTHVIPLLNALLPALDPNDISKSTLAFQVLGTGPFHSTRLIYFIVAVLISGT